MTATLAIVGRPNVGKSTLFNRLVGRKLALVDDQPGVTRDRRLADARLGDLTFQLIDTAGLEDAADGTLSARMRQQTEAAIAEADAVMFVIDARAGVTPIDGHFADIVRRAGRKVVLVANKAEGRAGEGGILDAYGLGLGEPVAISAEHGEGLADLREAIVVALPWIVAADEDEPDAAAEDATDRPLRVAIMGRPNAGKSTLINRLIGAERLLTGPEAGITRDSIAIDWEWQGRPIRLHDTAGLRKRARIDDKVEKLAAADGIRAARFAEVVVLLIDATMPFEKQDLTIADLIEREGRAIVIGVSKWDLVAGRKGYLGELRETVERYLPQISGVALVPVSAEAGSGLDPLMEAVFAAAEVWSRRVSTAALNRWLEQVLATHPPPAVSGRRIKIRYVTQPKSRPPLFALFGNQLGDLPDSYRRYLVNSLRAAFDLKGTPIRLSMRTSDNPYDKGKRRKG
jgi:GTP-binding protein